MSHQLSRRTFCRLGLGSLSSAAILSSPAWAEEFQRNVPNRDTFPVFGATGPLNNPKRFGHMVETDNCLVRCNTSARDAERVAQEFNATWDQIGRLADPWTNVHRRRPARPLYPQFEVGPVAVFVDPTPMNQYRAAPYSLQLVGNATMIYINVGPGQPSLAEQMPRLRLATAHSFLYETRLFEQLPEWVSDGMAGYVARWGLDDPKQAAMEVEGMIRFRGENRRDRRGPWALQPEVDAYEQKAVERFQFLLESDDGLLAPELFTALREAAAGPLPSDRTRLRESTRPPFLSATKFPTPVDRFFQKNRSGFPSWKENPLAGQPEYDSEDEVSDAEFQRQAEMMLILKLARRFSRPQSQTTGARVVEFGKDREPQVVDQPQVSRQLTVNMLWRQLTSPTRRPWATLDVDGSLLLSTDRERINQLLGNRDGRYRSGFRDGRWVLSYRQNNRSFVEGWLEDNPENQQRPLARFASRQAIPRKPAPPLKPAPVPAEPVSPEAPASPES